MSKVPGVGKEAMYVVCGLRCCLPNIHFALLDQHHVTAVNLRHSVSTVHCVVQRGVY